MRDSEKFRKDPRYKKYVNHVEKVLQSFDKEVNEWADFIAFLGKLLKVIRAYMSLKFVLIFVYHFTHIFYYLKLFVPGFSSLSAVLYNT